MHLLKAIALLTAALATGADAAQDPLGGGRLSAGILVRCQKDDSLCAVLNQKTQRLARRDPVAEARAAAEADNFRLGAVQTFGDPGGGGWDIPGADCRSAMHRELIGKWHAFDDYVTEAEARHTEASIRFIERYNRALLASPAYPDKDVCAIKGRTRAEAYAGPVISYAEAARTHRLSELQALEASGRTDFAARDKFDRTALAWAVYNGDAEIVTWLLTRTQDVSVSEYQTPLAAHALHADRIDMARAIVAAAGDPPSDTQLCEFRLYGPPNENKGCTWAGLLILKQQWDLLANLRTRGVDPGYEVALELDAALGRGDLPMAERVAILPSEGLDSWRLNQYLRARAWPILAQLRPGQLDRVARTRAEASVWDSAVQNRQWPAFAFLVDHGADLNLLSADRLEACRASAGAGDVADLFDCVKEAQAVRERFSAVVAHGDIAAAAAMLEEVTDLAERDKVGLAPIAFRVGNAAMMAGLVDAGLLIRIDANPGYGPPIGGSPGLRDGGFYDGALLAQVDAWASEGHDQALRESGWIDPINGAIATSDVDMLAALTRRPVRFLGRSASFAMERAGRTGMEFYPGDVDTSGLPDRPPEALDRILSVIAPAIVRAEGPTGLDELMRHAVAAGWNGLIADWVALGYEFSQAATPVQVIEAWAGFNGQCRPETAHFLANGKLNWRSVYRPEDAPMPIFQKIAATCRDSRTVAALVALGVGDVNELTPYGTTGLDEARQRNRTAMVAALRAAGARTAQEIDPDRARALKVQTWLGDDPDLMQTEDLI